MRRAVLVSVLLCSCQVSRHAQRGDAAMNAGKPAAALASYLAALDGPSKGDREVERKKNVAAVMVARQREKHAENREASGEAQVPMQLWAVVAADGWGSPLAKEIAADALTKVYERRLPGQAKAAEERRFEDAVRFADGVANVFGPDADMTKAARAVVAKIAEGLVASSVGAPSGARWFRLALASRYGAPVEPKTLERARPAEVSFALTGTTSAECARYVPSMPTSGEPQSAPTVVEWVLERCTVDVIESKRDEVYRHPETTAQTREGSVARYVRRPRDPACEAPAKCLRYDPLGVCVAHEERDGCEQTERVLTTVPTTVVEYETKTVTSTRTVHVRRYVVNVSGKLRIRRGDQGEEDPLVVHVAREDRAFWTPYETRQFSNQTISDAIRQTRRQLAQRVEAAVKEAVASRAKRIVAGDDPTLAPDEREHRFVVEALGTGRLSDAGARYFSDRYGVGRVAAEDVLRRRHRRLPSARPPQQSLPAPRSSPWEDRWEKRIVQPNPDDPERPQDRWSGMDVAFRFDGSPLVESSRMIGPLLRFRTEDVRLELAAGSANLGGDTGGFSADLAFYWDDMPFDDLYLMLGARFETTRNDTGEQTRFLGVPVTVALPLDATTLWVSAGINAWTIEMLTDDDANDPAFVWPLSVGATIDLGSRFYTKGRVTHFLFADSDEPLIVAFELGVRL